MRSASTRAALRSLAAVSRGTGTGASAGAGSGAGSAVGPMGLGFSQARFAARGLSIIPEVRQQFKRQDRIASAVNVGGTPRVQVRSFGIADRVMSFASDQMEGKKGLEDDQVDYTVFDKHIVVFS
jgi:hypothetical protein